MSVPVLAGIGRAKRELKGRIRTDEAQRAFVYVMGVSDGTTLENWLQTASNLSAFEEMLGDALLVTHVNANQTATTVIMDSQSAFKIWISSVHDVFSDGSAVATYKLDGNVTDLGGSYNGTWIGTAGYAEGVYGQAINLTGSNHVDVGTALLSRAEFSISLWLYAGLGISSNLFFISQYISNDANRFGIYVRSDYYVIVQAGGDPATSAKINAETWYHVVLTRKANDTWSLYVDDVSQDGFTNTSIPMSESLKLGAAGTDYYNMIGRMDQVRIFNRALTADEVSKLYNSGEV